MIFRATFRRTGSRCDGQVHDAHAAFADLLQQLVGTDLRAGAFCEVRHVRRGRQRDGGGFQESTKVLPGFQKRLHLGTQFRAGPTGPVEIVTASLRRLVFEGFQENLVGFDVPIPHELLPPRNPRLLTVRNLGASCT